MIHFNRCGVNHIHAQILIVWNNFFHMLYNYNYMYVKFAKSLVTQLTHLLMFSMETSMVQIPSSPIVTFELSKKLYVCQTWDGIHRCFEFLIHSLQINRLLEPGFKSLSLTLAGKTVHFAMLIAFFLWFFFFFLNIIIFY